MSSDHAQPGDVAGWLGAAWRVRLGDPLEDAAESLSLHGGGVLRGLAQPSGPLWWPRHARWAQGVAHSIRQWECVTGSCCLSKPSLLMSPAPFLASYSRGRASGTPRHPPCPFPWLSGEAFARAPSLKTVPLHSTGRPGAPQNGMYCATQQPCGHTALEVFTAACPKGSRCFSRELPLRGPGAARRAEWHW